MWTLIMLGITPIEGILEDLDESYCSKDKRAPKISKKEDSIMRLCFNKSNAPKIIIYECMH